MGRTVREEEGRVPVHITLHPAALTMLDELAEEDATTRSGAIDRLVRDEVRRRARVKPK